MTASLPHLRTRWPTLAAALLLAACGGPAGPGAPGDDPNAVGAVEQAVTGSGGATGWDGSGPCPATVPPITCAQPIWNTGSDGTTPAYEGATIIDYEWEPPTTTDDAAGLGVYNPINNYINPFDWDERPPVGAAGGDRAVNPITTKPYLEEVTLYGKTAFKTHKDNVLEILHQWEVQSGGAVRFVECKNCNTKPRIQFRPCLGGTSGTGKGAPQYSCVAPGYGVGAAHEIGHALGLVHEHQRFDRDRYLYLNPNGCDAAQNSTSWLAFHDDIMPKCSTSDRDFGIYDVRSLMQYPSRQGGHNASNPPTYFMTTTALAYTDGGDSLPEYVPARNGSALAELVRSAQWTPFRLVAPFEPSATLPLDGQITPGVKISGSPAAVRRPGGRTDVFVLGSDFHLYRRRMTVGELGAEAWSAYMDLGGAGAPWHVDPTAVLLGNGNVGVFQRDSTNHVYQGQVSTTGAWSWTNVLAGPPSGMCSAVTAVALGSGNYVDLLVQGCDDKLYIGGLNAGANAVNWSSVPVPHVDPFATWTKPGGASWGADRLDVFMTTAKNEVIWTYWTAAAGWQSKYTRVATGVLSSPSAVATGPNRLRVFVRGALDRLVKWTRWDGANWSDLWALGGLGTGDLGVAAGTGAETVNEGLKVYAVGDDSALWEKKRISAVRNTGIAPSVGNPTAYVRADGVSAVPYLNPSGYLRELCLGGQCGSTWHLGQISPNNTRASGLSSYVRADGVSAVVYQDVNYHVIEYSLGAMWSARDLTAETGAPLSSSSGNPAAYVRSDNASVVVYRGLDKHIYELGLPPNIQHMWAGDLTAITGAPAAGSSPVGYVRADGTNAVVYVDFTNLHVIELSLPNGSQQWHAGDLTAIANAPPALGVPRPYTRSDGTSVVMYRSYPDNHIRELRLPLGSQQWYVGDLTAITNATVAASDPAPYVRSDGFNTVIYRGSNNHIYELGLPPGSQQWYVGDLTAITGAPAATGTPSGYVRMDGTSAVVFRSAGDNHIRELSLPLGSQRWYASDLTPGGP